MTPTELCTNLEAAYKAALQLRDTPPVVAETMDPATFEYSRKMIAGLNATIRTRDETIRDMRQTISDLRDEIDWMNGEIAKCGMGLAERGA